MLASRVLICGGAGYIGSHAAKALRLAGREPVVFDDLSSGHAHAVKWGPLVQGDIRNAEVLRAAIHEHKPDAVMQFAARIEVGEGAVGLGGAMKLFGTDYPTPDGTCLRDYVHVTDLASAHILAADRLNAGSDNLQLNLGTGEGRTVLEVLKAVERATGRAVPVTISSRRPGDAVALYADPTKVRAALGWTPKHSDLDTIVSTAWAFHQKSWKLPQAAE